MGNGRHASVTTSGPGLQKLMDLVNELKINPEVRVGILANEKNNRTGAGGLTNVEVAILNEYGTATIPARPFIGTSGDVFRRAWMDLMTRTLGLAVDGKLTPVQALEIVGLRAVADMKKVLLESMWEPNAPSTIKRKGSSHPLIQSRQLLNSISSQASAQGTGRKR
jgi:hypothetical protein